MFRDLRSTPNAAGRLLAALPTEAALLACQVARSGHISSWRGAGRVGQLTGKCPVWSR